MAEYDFLLGQKSTTNSGEIKNIIFGSVIYPEAIQYLEELVNSIEEQTEKAFNILLLIDGVPMNEIESRISVIRNRCEIVDCVIKQMPPHLRIRLIEEARKRDADVLVIGDADDLFYKNRIERVIDTFYEEPSADFVYNDLILFNGEKALPDLPERVKEIKEIAEYNFLGLSNTAIRVKRLDESFIRTLYECDSFVFDWYLYARLLLSGHTGVKAKSTHTLYRLHSNNYAGLPTAIEDAIKKEIDVKKKHYNMLKEYSSLFEKLSDSYESRRISRTELRRYHYWWDLTTAVDKKIL